MSQLYTIMQNALGKICFWLFLFTDLNKTMDLFFMGLISWLGLSTLCPQKILLSFDEKLKKYVNSTIEITNVTESSKGNQLLNTFCIVHYLCFNVIY